VVSIRWIVTALAVGLTGGAVISVGVVADRNARRALAAEVTSRLLLESRNLALTSAGVLLSDYPELTLHPLIREKLAAQPELSFAVVVDRSGIVQGDADPHRLGASYVPPVGLRVANAPIRPGPGERLERTDRELVATVPVVHSSGTVLGHVVVGMRTSYLDAVLARARRQQSLVLLGFLIVAVGVTIVVMAQVLQPVVALRAGIDRIASGDLDTAIRVRGHTELGLLADAVNDMAATLKRAQAEMVERERLAREMELAGEIQASILPSAGVTSGAFVVEGAHRAAAEVGGDYFDYFPLPDGRIGLVIADVSGKGLAGCLVMAMLSALVRGARTDASSPAALLAALDERLSTTLRVGSFVTAFYGVLDPRTGRIQYASAGHNPTLVYRCASRHVETLRDRGIPLAAVRGGAIAATLEDREIMLEPGDILLQFTDGISEAFEPSGREQFGTARIEAALLASASEGARAVIDTLLEAVAGWTAGGPRLDDETLLVVRRDPAAEPARAEPPRPAQAPARTAPPRRTEAPAPEPEPRALVEEARRRGKRLALRAGADPLPRMRSWLGSSGPFTSLGVSERGVLTASLYEVCANVAEHGYGNDPGKNYELWWVPESETIAEPETGVPDAEEALRRVRAGWFLVLDHGRPFEANAWRGQDLSDSVVRRRGRGLGLEIIHRAMRQVVYYPASAVGNVTWLRFGMSPADPEEVRHAR
jgi:serine phosphatase RsbU (regulator of sigma subunit)/anti-sigma regulatory factor (Ser/Thr protein kinase)